MCTLIRHTICKSLPKIQYFRHECSLKMCKMKIPNKRNKIKWLSIACSYIWHIDISKYVYWLDIQSVNVWWRCVLPNANAAHFCDIFFRHSVGDLPRKTVSKINNPAPLGSTRIIYLTFSKYFRSLHKQITDRQTFLRFRS